MKPLRQTGAPQGGGAGNLRPVNPLALWLFRRLIAKRRLRKQFRAVRLAFADRLPAANQPEKLIFYLNHPSWWDPLLCMVLAERFIPGRNFYAPIEAAQLQRYAVLRPLGLFPVQAGMRGAAQFLRGAEAVLAQGDVLGLTPQGAFADARQRPPGLKLGLGALLARLETRGERVTIVPVAVEYAFWNQRLPEALAGVGEPLVTALADPARTAEEWTALLDSRLAATQDNLAALSLLRDERAFEVLLEGGRGAAGFYGLWPSARGDHKTKTGSGD